MPVFPIVLKPNELEASFAYSRKLSELFQLIESNSIKDSHELQMHIREVEKLKMEYEKSKAFIKL